MLVGHGDVRVLQRDLFDHARPQRTGVGEHVGLVHQRQVLAWPRGGAGERIAHHPLHAERGVDADLGRDLVRGVLAQQAAVTRVRALGALAHHDHVDLTGIGHRALHTRVQPGRPQVHVVVKLETQPQEQAALQDPAGHGRIAHRAEQDRVVLAEFPENGLGQQLPGRVPTGGAQVVSSDLDIRHDLTEDLERLGHHLRPDPVAGDHSEPHLHTSREPPRPAGLELLSRRLPAWLWAAARRAHQVDDMSRTVGHPFG